MTNERMMTKGPVLAQFLSRGFQALDVPVADADTVADLMVRADLTGYDTHGSFRMRQYVDRLRGGGTKAKANPFVVHEKPATALVDGDAGLGHLAIKMATELAIEKASSEGIGWVGVRNGNHSGPASIYVKMAVEKDMAAIMGAVGNSNAVAPFGGVEKLLGTNPLAIALPGGSAAPFVLDMATTTTAMGKVKVMAQRGETMPEGWMVDREGNPLTDASRWSEGLLLPLGGAKGYGLAMALGLLAGTMNGAAFGKDVINFTKNTTDVTNTGQFIAAVDVSAFGDLDVFRATIEETFRTFQQSEHFPGKDPVRIPGQDRPEILKDRLENGIPLHPNLVKVLSDIAQELGIQELSAA